MGDLRQLLRDNAQARARRPLSTAMPQAGTPGRGATIFLYDVLVSDATHGGIAAEGFVKAIQEAARVADTIHLRFNSPGGDVFAARAMEAAVRGCAKKVVAHVDGYAASAASYLALACDEVEIAPGGFFMIHRAWTLGLGNSEDLAATSALLAQIDVSLVETYAKETGLPARQIESMMAAETWISSKEAVTLGFADRITEDAPKAQAKDWDLSAYRNAPRPNTTTPETKPEKRNNYMDYGQKTHRLQQLGGLMDGMTSSPEPWTEEKARLYNSWEAEATELRSQVGAHQDALDRVAEALKLNNGALPGGVFPGGHNPQDARTAISDLGRFVRTNDVSAITPQAALTNDPASGGAPVRSAVANEIYNIARAYDPVRVLANIVTLDSATSKFTVPVNLGGATAGFVGETDARPTTAAPNLVAVSFEDSDLYMNLLASQWWLDDSQAGGWLIQELGRTLGQVEGQAFLYGTGVKQPKGLLHSPTSADPDATREFGTLQHLFTGSDTSIISDQLLSLVYSVKAEYRQNASRLMNASTIAAVRKLKNSTGDYLWSDGLAPGQAPLLAGYPVFECPSMEGPVSGATPVLFGDVKRCYTIVDRSFRILQDPYSSKPYVAFYVTKRVSGNIVDSNAVKALKMGASE